MGDGVARALATPAFRAEHEIAQREDGTATCRQTVGVLGDILKNDESFNDAEVDFLDVELVVAFHSSRVQKGTMDPNLRDPILQFSYGNPYWAKCKSFFLKKGEFKLLRPLLMVREIPSARNLFSIA